jgi:hypothetical protein
MNLIDPPSEITTIFEVFYAAPYPAYPGDQRSQLYASMDEAERMQAYYESCGSPSHIKQRTLHRLS